MVDRILIAYFVGFPEVALAFPLLFVVLPSAVAYICILVPWRKEPPFALVMVPKVYPKQQSDDVSSGILPSSFL